MLSDQEISDCIKKGYLKIDPFDEKLLGASFCYVRLGNNILVTKSGQVVDLSDNKSPEYKKINIEKNGYQLKPGEFILGQTYEEVTLGKNYGCFIDTRSTLARLGVSIHQNAMFIWPGQDAHVITLEIYNAGNLKVILHPGIKVAKLIFFKGKTNNNINFKGNYCSQKEVLGANVGSCKG